MNYMIRTQYCRIFMKFTGTGGNINTALSATYQMDVSEFFAMRWVQMNDFVNLLGNATYHFRSLVYNACISRWWWPTTAILQLWAESADWIISRLHFYITERALRGNRNFNVVRLCSKLVGDSLWSSGLCMPNFTQICLKNLWCGGEATINLNAHNSKLVM